MARVTIADAAPDAARPRPQLRGRHARSLLSVGVVGVSAALGLLAVAAAFTAGRLGYDSSPWANRGYWLGQGLILVPVAIRLLSPRMLSSGETVSLITVLTGAEYLVTICYSPAAFTYSDELEHWRSTVDVLQTGRLFTPNYVLPISPQYPGLEEVTSALASITGLSVFACGLIVAGIAHLLFVCVLYLLFREVSGSYRVAGVAVLCYASNSHFASFDSMFIYQTLALPFLGLTLLALRRLTMSNTIGERIGWCGLAALVIVCTAMTHHVTSYVLVVMLVVIALAALIARHWRTVAWAAILAVMSAGAVVGWLLLAAPETWTYLQPFAESMLQGVRALLSGGHPSTPSAGPLGDRVLAAAGVVIVSLLLPVGWWRVWRRSRNRPWTVAMAIASVSWYVIVAIRLTSADGMELAGRAATFTFVPAAYIVAVAVGRLAGAVRRLQARTVATAILIVVLVMIANGLANGWPPYWERLPGSYQVAGSERSVEPEVVDTANWTLIQLGPGNRFATDSGAYPVLGSYGNQDPIRQVAYLYTSRYFATADAQRARKNALRYIWVDQRMSQSLPAGGQYFPDDPKARRYKHPLPIADLTKFDMLDFPNGTMPILDRIYDSGNITIYKINGS
jgi:hypothetical protein